MLIDNLSKEQIQGIMDALPIKFLFVDQNNCLQYWNRGDEPSTEAPNRDYLYSALGKNVVDCHKKSSPLSKKILSEFKNGKRDYFGYWMLGRERKMMNRFFPIRDKSGKYLGTIEYVLDFTEIEQIAQDEKDALKIKNRFSVIEACKEIGISTTTYKRYEGKIFPLAKRSKRGRRIFKKEEIEQIKEIWEKIKK